jgi:hypothetical protein
VHELARTFFGDHDDALDRDLLAWIGGPKPSRSQGGPSARSPDGDRYQVHRNAGLVVTFW